MRTYTQRLIALAGLALAAVVFAGSASAQEPAPVETPALSAEQEAVHNELRALRDAMFGAWQKRDLEALLTHVAPNAVITWQNGETNRGHEGLRKFYAEVMRGDDQLVEAIESSLAVDELSILYGNETAVAFGSIHDDMTLGRKIQRAPFLGEGKISLDSRWTATLIKLDGQWQLAAYHVSMDAFSNPIIAKAIDIGKRLAVLAGVVCLILGVVVTWLVMRRKSAQA